jgi:hypothetical protein
MSVERTLFYWSIYVFLVGASLAVFPDLILSTIGLPETGEVWIRVVGINLLLLSLLYYESSRSGSLGFYLATVLGRLFVAGAFVVLWLTGEPWQLLIFAALELVGVTWTYSVLRANNP